MEDRKTTEGMRWDEEITRRIAARTSLLGIGIANRDEITGLMDTGIGQLER
jgi:hypothetical protein